MATLAGQFGVSIPSNNQSQSPEFYQGLLQSRALLRHIVFDTLLVHEMGEQRLAFVDLFKIPPSDSLRVEEQGVRVLREMLNTSIVKTTGVVEFAVTTRWPSVSWALASAMLQGVTDFNQRTRQGQAAAERKFVEGRLLVEGADLRAAEDRLERFLATNRQFGSPELSFQRERLQREVALRQQVFTLLTQSREEARIREVRDTPVVTIIESPAPPALPEPRRRVRRVLLGMLFGIFIGAAVVGVTSRLEQRRKDAGTDAADFESALADAKNDMRVRLLRATSWLRRHPKGST